MVQYNIIWKRPRIAKEGTNSIHAITHTEDTKTTGNEAYYVKMLRCAIEPEKLNMENSGSQSPFFAGAEAPVPVW